MTDDACSRPVAFANVNKNRDKKRERERERERERAVTKEQVHWGGGASSYSL